MIRKIYILVFVTIGFFLIPSISFACGSCSKDKIEKKEKKEKDCCNDDNHSSKHKECGGKCKHPSCNCIAPAFNIILTSFTEVIPNNNFDFSNEKKSFTFEESNISTGFYYIWTPPNIS